MSRVLPLRGSEEERVLNAALIEEFELFFSTDHARAFIGDVPICPVHHGEMPDEESMLALFEATRGCYPGDTCKRTDTGSVWLCTSNNGVLLTDWIELTLDRGAALADVSTTVGSLSVSNPPTQAEVEAIRDELAATNAALNTLLSRFRVTGGNGLLED